MERVLREQSLEREGIQILPYLLGAFSNLVGFTSCTVIAYFAFRVGRLGDRRVFLYGVGSFLIAIAFLIYGISLSINLFAIFYYHALLSTNYFVSFWKIASLCMLLGYGLIGGSYTMHRVWRAMLLALPALPFTISMLGIEATGIFLSFYLLFLISFTTIKTGRKEGFLSVFGYLLLFLAQCLTTWGLLNGTWTLFLWGVALRGIGFIPILLVALTTGGR